jgi:nucleoside-diphosphate-sugar epimerase
LLHPIGLNRHQSTINPKKAILVKKKYTNKIIEFAKKNSIKKIIYLSTIHVYSKNLSGIDRVTESYIKYFLNSLAKKRGTPV